MAAADNAAGARANGMDTGIRGLFSRGDARKRLTRWLIVHCHDKKHLTRMDRISSEPIRIFCSVSGYGAHGGQYQAENSARRPDGDQTETRRDPDGNQN
jgi:hypothetical protein